MYVFLFTLALNFLLVGNIRDTVAKYPEGLVGKYFCVKTVAVRESGCVVVSQILGYGMADIFNWTKN
jgi:hypothetical protein